MPVSAGACPPARLADDGGMSAPRYSLVAPFYNEAGNISPLLEVAREVLSGLDGASEVLLIDDGSTDGTAAELAEVAAADPYWHVIRFERNTGQAAALLAGLRQARGEIILTMDGDGQNDPRDFPALLGVLERGGADLVCGLRATRHDSPLRRFMSRIANGVRGFVLRDRVHDAGCQLRVFRREVIGALWPSPMMQSFLPAMAVASGFRVREVPVRHHPRLHGAPKYGLRNLWWRPFVEMLRVWRESRRRARPAGATPRR